MLSVRSLEKSFATAGEALPVIRGVDLDAPAGRSVAIMGESGSGKSTLLHLIAGLERPDAGEVRLDGARVDGLDDGAAATWRRAKLGLVFQQFNLIPSLSVIDNIRLQARLAGAEDPAWTAKLVGALGLAGLEGRWPEQLSGGQQQRVAIARALAPRPPLILADEPTGNLDEETGDRALAAMLELVRAAGAILVMATHSARIAAQLDETRALRGGRLA